MNALGCKTVCFGLLIVLGGAFVESVPAWSEEETAPNPLPWIKSAEDKYQAGDYVGASRDYLRAHREGSKPWVIFNAALCSEKARHYQWSIALYELYLEKETEPDLYSGLVSDATEMLKELPKKLVRLTIQDAPGNAVVRVNREVITSRWQEAPIVMDPGTGEFLVEVSCDGYESLEKTLTLWEGADAIFTAALKPLPDETMVYVYCRGEETRVFLDHKLVGSCPVSQELPSGPHVLEVEGRGKETFRKKLTLEPRKPVTVPVTLSPKKWPMILGATMAGLVAVSLGVGTVLNVKWRGYREKADEASNTINEMGDYAKSHGGIIPDEEKWMDVSDSREENKAKEDKTRQGMVAAFAAGIGLIAVGSGLLIHYIKQKKKGEENYGISMGPSSVVISF